MINAFSSLSVRQHLVEALERLHITQPTLIQEQAIPPMLEGKDVIAQSHTGTGKTLAYLLPVLQRLESQELTKEVQAVVLVPTRELGMQILHVIESMTEGKEVVAQALIGGASMQRQVEKLRMRPQIVVGTPGRVLEIIKLRKLKMHYVRTMVIDEADQVFALGSVQEVDEIIKSTMRDRQLAFFSATIPPELTELANKWMKAPQCLEITGSQRTAGTLEHVYYLSEERDKIDTLRRLVRMYKPDAAIVFINEINAVAELIAKLQYVGLAIEALYGDQRKQERAAVMDKFRKGKLRLLLATDVAARGLDIPGITHVIHFDPAADADHYLHRAGRTGRMGKSGTVVSIITPKEQFILRKFEKSLHIEIVQKEMYRGKSLDSALPKKTVSAQYKKKTDRNKVKPIRKERSARYQNNKGTAK